MVCLVHAVLLLAAASTSAASLSSAGDDSRPPSCPRWSDGSVRVPPEHAYDVCDRRVNNDPSLHASRMARAKWAASNGSLHALDDERTWLCPTDDGTDHSFRVKEGGTNGRIGGGEGGGGGWAEVGLETKWIVRNAASTAVSVALVDGSRSGVEVSAADAGIRPAHADPNAVLSPGEWRSFDVVLGTVLNVRELLTEGGQVVPGRVLLRHRPGPIAFKDRTGKAGPRSSSDVVPPPKPKARPPAEKEKAQKPAVPKRNTAPTYKKRAAARRADVKPPDPKGDDKGQEDAGPSLTKEEKAEREASRPQYDHNRRCNPLNVVFANRGKKAVEVHWAGMVDADISQVNVTVKRSSGAIKSAAGCDSRLAFHLGTDASVHDDFLDTWDSFMSYESTYLGHRFVARLASDPSVVVDEIFMARTQISDCPHERDEEMAIKLGERLSVGAAMRGRENSTSLYAGVEGNKTTAATTGVDPEALSATVEAFVTSSFP